MLLLTDEHKNVSVRTCIIMLGVQRRDMRQLYNRPMVVDEWDGGNVDIGQKDRRRRLWRDIPNNGLRKRHHSAKTDKGTPLLI